MGSKKAPSAPAFQGSQYQINGQTKSSTYKQGDNIITNSTLTPQETQSYNYLQGQLPALYRKATTPTDFSAYTKAYTNNQKSAVNRDYTEGLRTLNNQLYSSGQLGGSQALDRLRPVQDAYLQSMQDIEAKAPTYANDLLNAEIARNTAMLGTAVDGINGFYNTGNTFNNNAVSLSTTGNNWAQTNYGNAMADYNAKKRNGLSNAFGYINPLWAAGTGNTDALKTQAQIAGAFMMSDEKTKQNITKIGENNGLNIYEFEFKPEYEQPAGKHIGVIAQEVEQVLPDAVKEINGIKHVDYNRVNQYFNEVA